MVHFALKIPFTFFTETLSPAVPIPDTLSLSFLKRLFGMKY